MSKHPDQSHRHTHPHKQSSAEEASATASLSLVPGTFTKEKFGYSLPLDVPLFGSLTPLRYTDVTILIFPYFTGVEQAAALVPPPLQVVSVNNMAIATIIFAQYQASDIGPYNEVAQTIAVVNPNVTGSDGQPMQGFYPVRLHVTTDIAMAAGREIGGFPKKLGAIRFSSGEQCQSSLTDSDGRVICSGEVTKGPVLPVTTLPQTYFSARVLPPIGVDAPTLVQSLWVLEGTFNAGQGSLTLNPSASDPYAKLPVVAPMPPPQPGVNLPFTGIFTGAMTLESLKAIQQL